MRTYHSYLDRWRQRFGEEPAGRHPYYVDGVRCEVVVERVDQTVHEQLWERLLDVYRSWIRSDSEMELGIMSLIETELLVRGHFFHPSDADRPEPKPTKAKPKRKNAKPKRKTGNR